jgi:hypothetical protein
MNVCRAVAPKGRAASERARDLCLAEQWSHLTDRGPSHCLGFEGRRVTTDGGDFWNHSLMTSVVSSVADDN